MKRTHAAILSERNVQPLVNTSSAMGSRMPQPIVDRFNAMLAANTTMRGSLISHCVQLATDKKDEDEKDWMEDVD